MASPVGFCLTDYAILLGALPEATSVSEVELMPLVTAQNNYNDTELNTAFIQDIPSCDKYIDRLLMLLQRLLLKYAGAFERHTVYLVLPEFAGPDNPRLAELLQKILSSCPGLLQSEHSRVFPYGCAGSLMALAAAQRQLQQVPDNRIWLIAVDSYSVETELIAIAKRAPQWVLSEAAVGLCLTGAVKAGVQLRLSQSDACLNAERETPDDNVLGALFRQVTAQSPVLQQIYLPDSGEFTATERWLLQYHWLSGVVDENTRCILPSYFTGELRACGGIYRLLHLLQAYKTKRIQGPTLQFELSERQYRAVAVFDVQD